MSFNITDKKEVKAGLKEWKCVLVGHHENVGKTIEEWQKAGWRLHAYQTQEWAEQ